MSIARPTPAPLPRLVASPPSPGWSHLTLKELHPLSRNRVLNRCARHDCCCISIPVTVGVVVAILSVYGGAVALLPHWRGPGNHGDGPIDKGGLHLIDGEPRK